MFVLVFMLVMLVWVWVRCCCRWLEALEEALRIIFVQCNSPEPPNGGPYEGPYEGPNGGHSPGGPGQQPDAVQVIQQEGELGMLAHDRISGLATWQYRYFVISSGE